MQRTLNEEGQRRTLAVAAVVHGAGHLATTLGHARPRQTGTRQSDRRTVRRAHEEASVRVRDAELLRDGRALAVVEVAVGALAVDVALEVVDVHGVRRQALVVALVGHLDEVAAREEVQVLGVDGVNAPVDRLLVALMAAAPVVGVVVSVRSADDEFVVVDVRTALVALVQERALGLLAEVLRAKLFRDAERGEHLVRQRNLALRRRDPDRPVDFRVSEVAHVLDVASLQLGELSLVARVLL